MKISNELEKAREYEEKESAFVKPEKRPVYHLSPRIGWLNDPNGLSFYGGEYHLFYQYHPYDSYWGPMHWGHAVSRDLVRWNYLPCVMAPDTDYDRMGCFSGSAITTTDGKHLLIYTGCAEDKDDPQHRWIQSQNIAIGDGREYVKYPGNPVINEDDLPEGGDTHEFRDPYIWSTGAGRYCAVAANANLENGGITQMTLYKSEDGFHWKRSSVLFEDRIKIGIMWECPNFFPLGTHYVLIASPMDMEKEEADGSVRFPEGSNVCCMIGRFDDEAGRFEPIEDPITGRYQYDPVDAGLDFYAPQVLQAPDGRMIMIGWMQNPKESMKHDRSEQIFGQMTVPRELFINRGKLCQKPVRELSTLRGDKIEHHVTLNSDDITLEGVKGRSLELEVRITADDDQNDLYSMIRIRFAKNDKYYTELRYRPGQSILTIDRSRSGLTEGVSPERSVAVRPRKGRIKFDLLLDRWSAEIFINDGEQTASLTYYTDPSAQDITFGVEGGSADMDLTMYRLDPDNTKEK